ncbi:MAG: ImmA/IrrE family metallo-endopeptidase [Clostridiales bacterium]|jgi:Zn-dependent peptidase ImmA (M78 family)|nr:ImmA/IrrE family metallo-endopeptidase [Clostridiales bacterium]NLM58601.1 ImmA/IrrE family metallo-endopeptidase [Clostridium sp.]
MLSEKIVVPFIDKTILDISYARKILNTFNKSLNTEMQPVPIDEIVLDEGLIIKTANITMDRSIHGMLVCGQTDVDLWDSENKITYTLFCKEETIFIDESLLEPALKNRYRFTLAHEYAHWILHSKIIRKLAKEKKRLPYLTCQERNINMELIEKVETSCEWQANFLAGAILMPYLPLKQYCKMNELKNNEDTNYVSEQIRHLATKYSVSEKAMYVRLRQLNYIDFIEFYER